MTDTPEATPLAPDHNAPSWEYLVGRIGLYNTKVGIPDLEIGEFERKRSAPGKIERTAQGNTPFMVLRYNDLLRTPKPGEENMAPSILLWGDAKTVGAYYQPVLKLMMTHFGVSDVSALAKFKSPINRVTPETLEANLLPTELNIVELRIRARGTDTKGVFEPVKISQVVGGANKVDSDRLAKETTTGAIVRAMVRFNTFEYMGKGITCRFTDGVSLQVQEPAGPYVLEYNSDAPKESNKEMEVVAAEDGAVTSTAGAQPSAAEDPHGAPDGDNLPF